MTNPLWFVADIAAAHLLARNFGWVPLRNLSPEEFADDDGDLWAFHSEREAQAFADGYRVCGGFAVPWRPVNSAE